jgi:hypothetical protein
MQTANAKTVVDIDTRRKVFMAARGRKPQDVAKVPHEAFIRNLLKDCLGWKRDQPAPDHVKQVAKQMAEQFKAEDKARAEAKQKARDEQAAREKAANAEQDALRAKTEASAAAGQ